MGPYTGPQLGLISHYENIAVFVDVPASGNDRYGSAGPRLQRLPIVFANEKVDRHGKLQVRQRLFGKLLEHDFAMRIKNKARFEIPI